MAGYLENRTYFPIMKLMYVVERLNVMESREHGYGQHNGAGKTVASSSSGGVKFVRSTSGNSSSGGVGNENSRGKVGEK